MHGPLSRRLFEKRSPTLPGESTAIVSCELATRELVDGDDAVVDLNSTISGGETTLWKVAPRTATPKPAPVPGPLHQERSKRASNALPRGLAMGAPANHRAAEREPEEDDDQVKRHHEEWYVLGHGCPVSRSRPWLEKCVTRMMEGSAMVAMPVVSRCRQPRRPCSRPTNPCPR